MVAPTAPIRFAAECPAPLELQSGRSFHAHAPDGDRKTRGAIAQHLLSGVSERIRRNGLFGAQFWRMRVSLATIESNQNPRIVLKSKRRSRSNDHSRASVIICARDDVRDRRVPHYNELRGYRARMRMATKHQAKIKNVTSNDNVTHRLGASHG
jgi:hypothetical protein